MTTPSPSSPSTDRVYAIDVLRGLTILTMIFVNDLASVREIPWWMKHMPENADGMTFVDVVFPAFLFIVGMAIPYAMDRRLQNMRSGWQILPHILLRTAGLIVLGVLMVNIHAVNAAATGLTSDSWSILMFLGAILVWNHYDTSTERRSRIALALRITGGAAILVLAAIYRGGSPDALHWLRTSWWGILGLIGWAYLISSLAYLGFRRNLPGLVGALGILVLLYGADKAGAFASLRFISDSVWIGGHLGAHASVTTAGVILGVLLKTRSRDRVRPFMLQALAYGVMLAVAGFLLQPLYGVNKIAATPAWCLYSAAICTVLFVLLYWLIDLRGHARWFAFASPAGANPLLAYILPDIFYALVGMFALPYFIPALGTGIVGIIRSLIFALVMVGATNLLTRRGIRLHL